MLTGRGFGGYIKGVCRRGIDGSLRRGRGGEVVGDGGVEWRGDCMSGTVGDTKVAV